MIKNRINYWSCSRFANWVRGEKKPFALGFDEWDEWHDEVKAKKPFRHFLAEDVLDRAQDFFCLPFDLFNTLRAYWDNRFVHKTHFLKTGLDPGRYYELDDRILHALFNELKEFVEVDLAYTHMACSDEDFKPKGGRCPDAGIAHLKWAMNLKFDEGHGVSKKSKKYGKPTRQAEVCKDIMEIYNWWNSREDRPDPAEISGWQEAFSNQVPKDERMILYKKMKAIERKYEREDDKMLNRLLEIRRDLWC